MNTIGQNSPATPEPSTAEPSGVGSRPVSLRIDTSAPSVVVQRATPSSHHSASRPACCSARPTRSPIAREIAHPDRAARQRRRGNAPLDDLQPGEEEEEAEAEVGE